MWWSNLFAGMSPASFFNFSFLPKYGLFFIQGVEYTLLLAVVAVALAVIPALLLALMLLLIYPMDYVQGTWTSYASGWLANTGYIVFLLYGLLIFAMLVIFCKKLDTRVRWALFPMLGVTTLVVLLQIRYPELLMTSGMVLPEPVLALWPWLVK